MKRGKQYIETVDRRKHEKTTQRINRKRTKKTVAGTKKEATHLRKK